MELQGFIIVCSARALSNGCKSRVSPKSGNYIAKGKGVHRELESERSRRQTSVLNRQKLHIRHMTVGKVAKQTKAR